MTPLPGTSGVEPRLFVRPRRPHRVSPRCRHGELTRAGEKCRRLRPRTQSVVECELVRVLRSGRSGSPLPGIPASRIEHLTPVLRAARGNRLQRRSLAAGRAERAAPRRRCRVRAVRRAPRGEARRRVRTDSIVACCRSKSAARSRRFRDQCCPLNYLPHFPYEALAIHLARVEFPVSLNRQIRSTAA